MNTVENEQNRAERTKRMVLAYGASDASEGLVSACEDEAEEENLRSEIMQVTE